MMNRTDEIMRWDLGSKMVINNIEHITNLNNCCNLFAGGCKVPHSVRFCVINKDETRNSLMLLLWH